MAKQLSASYIFDDFLPALLAERPDVAKQIRAILSVNIYGKDGGKWTGDFISEMPSINKGLDEQAKCTLHISSSDFEWLVASKTVASWLDAFTKRKIRVTGHLPTALRLRVVFEALAGTEHR